MTSRKIDTLLWFALPVLLLFLVPVGFVSNDGLGHSRSFADGNWGLNPNHLLFEPLGAWWQGLWAGSQREPVDVLKLLSALFGAAAAALFRYGVAPRLAGTRWAANHATAWVAFSSAFLRLWVSDEIHMIQMPFVVLIAWAALRYLERPSPGRALAIGAAVGLATLAFISNLALGATLAAAIAVWHLRRREARLALGSAVSLGLGAAMTAGPVFLGAWLTAPGSLGFFAWLTRYSGGRQSPRIAEAYGLVPSWAGLAESALRAVYGAASALVDLIPFAAILRDRQPPAPTAVLGLIAFLLSSLALLSGLRKADRNALLLMAAWLAAILGFGLFWNNSDDQFYFQLAPIFGVLAARTTRKPFLALSLAALLWNLIDVTTHRILYPRWERMALLEKEVRGACLVVYPGFDEPEMLLVMSPSASPIDRIAMTQIAGRYPYEEGMRNLTGRIERCLSGGGRVVLIDIFETPPDRNPWKFLRRLGYDHGEVERELAGLPLEQRSRRVGPFLVRESWRVDSPGSH